jgi:hypothetical protein
MVSFLWLMDIPAPDLSSPPREEGEPFSPTGSFPLSVLVILIRAS